MVKGPTLPVLIPLQDIIVLNNGMGPFNALLFPPAPFINGNVPTSIITPAGLFLGEFSLDTMIPEGNKEVDGPVFYWERWTKLQTTLIISQTANRKGSAFLKATSITRRYNQIKIPNKSQMNGE